MSSFRTDVVQHLSFLRSRAMSLTKNAITADDLIQDTVLKAYRFEHKFKPNNLKSWLFRVMTNIFLSNYCKNSTVFERGFVDPGEEGIDRLTPEEPSRIDELRLDVVHAMNKLSQDQADLLIMADVEGLSYKEIAAKLEIPIGTVMSRIFRARQRMFSYL